jgi:hypothetical protein
MSLSVDKFFNKLPDIAFFGKMRAGKDEAYKILAGMGFSIERIAFGDVMKKKFSELFPNIPMEPKPIELLQQFGQSMREIDENVWVRPTMKYIELIKDTSFVNNNPAPSFVFTDVRQPNEFKACKDAGCIMVYINTPEWLRVERMLEAGEKVTREILDAPTERHVDSWVYNRMYDYKISNHGDLDEFQAEIRELVYKIQTEKGNN